LGELSDFGLCGKELACQTCLIHVNQGYDVLVQPQEAEEDVFDQLGMSYKSGVSRMACQIRVCKRLENCHIEIPKEAFGDS
jgi:ferredoxin